MPLHEMQSVLARLYTDSSFRTRFFDDPSALSTLRLTETERQSLAGINRAQVERFARSLFGKRHGQVRELLPGAAAALGTRFRSFFSEHCLKSPSAPDRLDDARGFIQSVMDRRIQEPAYLPDLLRLETLRLDILYPKAPPSVESKGEITLDSRLCLTQNGRVASFGFDIERLYESLLGDGTPVASSELCTALIGRVQGSMRVKIRKLNPPTARLIEQFDGSRPLRAAIAETADFLHLSNGDRARFESDCLAFARTLVDSGLATDHRLLVK